MSLRGAKSCFVIRLGAGQAPHSSHINLSKNHGEAASRLRCRFAGHRSTCSERWAERMRRHPPSPIPKNGGHTIRWIVGLTVAVWCLGRRDACKQRETQGQAVNPSLDVLPRRSQAVWFDTFGGPKFELLWATRNPAVHYGGNPIPHRARLASSNRRQTCLLPVTWAEERGALFA
jgi:hypothetical protein